MDYYEKEGKQNAEVCFWKIYFEEGSLIYDPRQP